MNTPSAPDDGAPVVCQPYRDGLTVRAASPPGPLSSPDGEGVFRRRRSGGEAGGQHQVPRRRRIVFVAPFATYPKGTTRARIIPLARALAARGHTVTVLVPPYDHPAEAGHCERAGAALVRCLPLPRGVAGESLAQAPGLAVLSLRLARAALALRPDIIHLGKPKAVSGLVHLLLWHWRQVTQRWPGRSDERRLPALVLDTDDWEGHGGWNEYETYAAWQKAACDWQERWGIAHADAMTVASRTLQTQAWSRQVPRERVAYLPNGLDPEDYPGWTEASGSAWRQRLGLDGQPTVLLYTRFFEFAPERPIRLLAALRQQVPNACLLVVGAGKYSQERRLAAEAQRQGLQAAVRLTGWLDRAELPAALRAADVALVLADDTLANRAKCSVKLAELLWLGIPVVAERVGEHATYVEHRQSGWLVDPGDDRNLGQALVALLRHPPQAAALAAAGHTRITEHFSWAALAPQAEAAYAAALAAPPWRR